METEIVITVYSPYVSSEHEDDCAGLCTDSQSIECEEAGHHHGCMQEHRCWCPDGSLAYSEFFHKHPDATVAMTRG
jgi:hypothetical protein